MKTSVNSFFQQLSSVWLWLILVLSTPDLVAQDSSYSAFQEANAAYNDANYEKAAALYEQILDAGLQSSEVYYNLGNA